MSEDPALVKNASATSLLGSHMVLLWECFDLKAEPPTIIHYCNSMVLENNGGTTSLHFYFDTTIRIILSSKSTLNPIGFSFSDKPKKGCLFRIISSGPSSFTFCSRTDREHCKWGSFTWSTRVKYDGIPSTNSRAPEALWREEPVLGNMKLQL